MAVASFFCEKNFCHGRVAEGMQIHGVTVPDHLGKQTVKEIQTAERMNASCRFYLLFRSQILASRDAATAWCILVSLAKSNLKLLSIFSDCLQQVLFLQACYTVHVNSVTDTIITGSGTAIPVKPCRSF